MRASPRTLSEPVGEETTSEKVVSSALGITNNTNCTTSAPCYSLSAKGMTGTYSDGCDFTEVALYDFAAYDDSTKTGEWKGKQRMLHTAAPHVAWTYFDLPPIMAAAIGLYQRTEIGWVTNNTTCPGFTGYHVHHDFMPPTFSQYCQWGMNTSVAPVDPNAPKQQTDWRKEDDVRHWVHSLIHTFGTACVVPGPYVADFLLNPNGGALDGTDEGTLRLATTGLPDKRSRLDLDHHWTHR